jgi:hypothetical protein
MHFDTHRRMAWLGFDLLVTVVCAVVLIHAIT